MIEAVPSTPGPLLCVQPDCTGAIEDGYCDVCGRPPVRTTPAAYAPDEDSSATSHMPPPRLNSAAAQSDSTSAGVGTKDSGTSQIGAATSSRPSGGTSTTSRSSITRGRLGEGLVMIPPVPYRDPSTVVLRNPELAEAKRFCAEGHPVGRSRDGEPGRLQGFCPQCGTAFDFRIKLQPGEVVNNHFRIVGCIAHGGLGWVYLAQDTHLDDHWRVLKGLLDSGDASAMAAAINERRFLVQVQHPNIVIIYDFVNHGGASYIVMEYVGGASLKEIRTRPRESANGDLVDQQHVESGQIPEQGARVGRPIPLGDAIAYILEILPALAYLHSRGYLYCDFKPDNVIHSADQIKLIDLGAVRSVDDNVSDIYGTPGYRAPEIEHVGPSVSSDLYTVARTLAVLTFDFHGYQTRHAYSLPPAAKVPLFTRYPAFHAFLLRATNADPALRFQNAADMRDQLLGVLRQVVATDRFIAHAKGLGAPDQTLPSAEPSKFFGTEQLADPDSPAWRTLPLPLVNIDDPGAGILANLPTDPDQIAVALGSAPPTAEILLRRARAAIESGDLDSARATLDAFRGTHGPRWRLDWWHGILRLAANDPPAAVRAFATVAAWLPGEFAPRLALAVAHEAAGQPALAADEYRVVAFGDSTMSSALFGLSRCCLALGDRTGATSALALVPDQSVAATAARVRRFEAFVATVAGSAPTLADLCNASTVMAGMRIEPAVRLRLTRDLCQAGLELLGANGTAADPDVQIAGFAFTEAAIRGALEQTNRGLARLATSDAERVALVDQANACRPWTTT